MSGVSSRKFTIEVANEDEPISRATRRVVINVDIMKQAKLYAGDEIAIASPNSTKAIAVGVAWPSSDISQDRILVSPPLLLTARVSQGSTVNIFPLGSSKIPRGVPSLRNAVVAHIVRINESLAGSDAVIPDVVKGKRRDWLMLAVKEALVEFGLITITQTFDLAYEGKTRRISLTSVSAVGEAADTTTLDEQLGSLSLKDAPAKLWSVTWDTTIVLDVEDPKEKPESTPEDSGTAVQRGVAPDAYAAVGGLDKQIAQIRDLIEIPLTRPELFRRFGLKPPRGILLHGPPGTGKTHLARAIAASTGAAVLTVNGPELSSAYHGETEARLRDVFAEARGHAACIVVLDEVDALCPRREDGAGGEVEKRVVAQLLTLMDGMDAGESGDGKGKVVVVATTNRPNAIDPALRRPGRFDREIEIGVPDAEARFAILKVLLAKAPHTLSDDDLRAVAAPGHGYVGADLSAVVREAGTLAIKRWLAASPGSPSQPVLELADLRAALPAVRPSALRALVLDSAPVRYADIGGQAAAVARLRECVEWPLRHPEAFARLGVGAPRGVLLYGPPGCSKTLLVRACATESGVNFLAVKGPELLNKYVGESERAVREIFGKARAAAPAIIFFDEIDALATSRSDSGGGAHEGVLTSLLTEMDGVEALNGVTVVAATNRPDVIDSALMRPGRLDRILYVGPPDLEGRKEILQIRTRTMSIEPGEYLSDIAALTEGCSGAEITALCQEAALLAMKADIDTPFVPRGAFMEAAKHIKKQITPEVVATYTAWRDKNGLVDA
ncbi:AAA family ATPase [Epithele typhae]|uniref:AAA family ATPase n=1 Tax=Epithele typhae TaxID=378194 RepID=UPI0020073331|nr:AAA family ATPase [Epithele typhae]KAH9919180.1 AAA family ATPase [Epithele typhae]